MRAGFPEPRRIYICRYGSRKKRTLCAGVVISSKKPSCVGQLAHGRVDSRLGPFDWDRFEFVNDVRMPRAQALEQLVRLETDLIAPHLNRRVLVSDRT